MKPLLRKDAPWLLGFGLAGLTFALSLFGAEEGPWIRPEDRHSEMALAFYWFAATLLGLVAAVVDDLTRTREYLLHRSLPPQKVFWTRQLGGLAVVAAWVFLVPALHLAFSLLFRADSFLIEAGRYWHLVDSSCAAFVFYAAGVFSGTVVRRLIWALPLAALCSGGALLVFLPRVIGRAGSFLGVPAVALALPLAVVFLVAAQLAVRDGREADLPWTRARVLTGGALLLLMVIPGSSLLLGSLEQGSVELLFDVYPELGQQADGKAVLFLRPKQRRKLLAVDSRHQVMGELAPERIERSFNPDRILDPSPPLSVASVRQQGRRFGHRFTRYYPCPGELLCYLSSDGYIDLVREAPHEGARDWGEPVRLRVGQPDNQPFPPSAMPVGHWWAGPGFMADLETGRLWAADLTREEPRFALLPLPGGDRLRHEVTHNVAQAPRFRAVLAPLLVVAGDRGIYTLGDMNPGAAATLVPASPEIADIARRVVQDRNKKVAFTRRGITGLDVTVDWGDGIPVLRHDYAPRTLVERALAASLYGTALVRPPGFSLLSHITPVPPSRHPSASWMLSAVAPALPALVIVAQLALALLLTAVMWRRLRRFQMSPARRAFWVGLTLLGGLPAFFCALFIETRRAWLPVPVPSEERPATEGLLIQTA